MHAITVARPFSLVLRSGLALRATTTCALHAFRVLTPDLRREVHKHHNVTLQQQQRPEPMPTMMTIHAALSRHFSTFIIADTAVSSLPCWRVGGLLAVARWLERNDARRWHACWAGCFSTEAVHAASCVRKCVPPPSFPAQSTEKNAHLDPARRWCLRAGPVAPTEPHCVPQPTASLVHS